MDCKCISKLENFPDELFLLICRYLSVVEILNGFSCLNNRLSKIINEFSRRIDLNMIPSKLINRFVNEIFPYISLNVRSLICCDNCERFSINCEIFPNLQSIHFLNNFEINNLINIEEIKIDLVPGNIQMDLIEKLFSSNSYSNLRSLSLISFHGFTFSNIQLTNLSQIQNLKITLKNNIDLLALLHLLSNSIEHLDIHILYNGPFLLSSTLKLSKLHSFHLKTTFEDSIQFKELQKLIIDSFHFIQYLSIENLTRDQNYIDGFKWEKFLKELIYLKYFHCSIRYRFQIDQNFNHQIKEEQLLNSFSTHFWLNQRKWFINSYSTITINQNNHSNNYFKTKNYGKLFLHTIPYPYPFMDATIDITKAKSTVNQYISRSIYSNVRHLYYDGEDIPIKFEDLKKILHQFRSINELKLDRLIIDYCSSSSTEKFNLYHLNKLIIYNNITNEKNPLNIHFLNFFSLSNLRSIRIPQISLPDYSPMVIQLETLILTECRDLHFDFIHKYRNLRLLKLHLNHFDRLLENNGELLKNLINSIYSQNKIIESLILMCPGANQQKVKIFEKQFNRNNIDYLSANYDGKCLTIQRSNDYFNETV